MCVWVLRVKTSPTRYASGMMQATTYCRMRAFSLYIGSSLMFVYPQIQKLQFQSEKLDMWNVVSLATSRVVNAACLLKRSTGWKISVLLPEPRRHSWQDRVLAPNRL